MNSAPAKVKRGQSVVCGALALGLAGCSSSVKLPTLGGPPEQRQEMGDCDALNAEKARLLAERDDLTTPLLPSNADTGREAKVPELNGKLYTVAKAQFDKECPTAATGPTGSVVR